MQLAEIFSLSTWMPLSELVGTPDPDCFVARSIYQLGDHIFLCVSHFNGNDVDNDLPGPFLTGVLWAPDSGAAKRAMSLEIEADNGADAPVPEDFLPDCGPTYGEILEALKKQKTRVCLETASYRIATDGAFVHRQIENEAFKFFFRSPMHDGREAPYAVIRKLKS